VIANDLSPTAAAAMRRNVDYNAIGVADTAPTENVHATKKEEWKGKVRVNEGDAL
jgi:tRNA (guanine26-N2/guanine27-N2)-dimethyltransferase